MNTVARLAAALVAAATFAVPMTSFAEGKPASAPTEVRHEHGGGAHHGNKDKAQFPMKADEFRVMVEKKIEKIKARVEKGMERHKVPAVQRTVITKAVDEAAKQVRGAVDKAAVDGTVTKEEAKQVRELAEQLRTKIRGELGGKHAKAGKAKHRQR
jgi:predicted transcriptional regulator